MSNVEPGVYTYWHQGVPGRGEAKLLSISSLISVICFRQYIKACCDSVWLICKFLLKQRGLSVTLVAPGGSNLLTSFLLEGHAKNAIAYALPVQRVKGGAGLLFIQVHKTEAATAPRHDVRG